MARNKMVASVKCPCGRAGFADDRLASKALGRARSYRMRNAPDDRTLRGVRIESRTYQCDQSDLLHLTAQSRRSFQLANGLVAA